MSVLLSTAILLTVVGAVITPRVVATQRVRMFDFRAFIKMTAGHNVKLAARRCFLQLAFFIFHAVCRWEASFALCYPSLQDLGGVQNDVCSLDGNGLPVRLNTKKLFISRVGEEKVNICAPFQAWVGVPVGPFLALVPTWRVYEMAVHHMDLHRFGRPSECAARMCAAVVACLVPDRPRGKISHCSCGIGLTDIIED